MQGRQLERLEGFLKLLNSDLDNLPLLEVYGVCQWLFYVELKSGQEDDTALRDMKLHCVDLHERGYSDRPRELMTKLIYEVKTMQQQFRAFFDNLVQRLRAGEAAYHAIEGSATENRLERVTLGTVQAEIQLTGIVHPERQRKDIFRGLDTANPQFLNEYEKGGFPSLTFEVETKVARDLNGILFGFLQALDGLRLDQLVECKNCKTWFVRRDQRPRYFCSRKCSTQDYNRKKAEELKAASPEERERVMAQARGRAHKSYQRKQEPNLAPGAKVQRRPRKPI